MVRQISTKRTLLFNNKQLTPITPSSLAANDISDSEIDLIWQDNSSNETHFVLEKSLDGVSGWGVVVTTAPNVTSYSDTGLSSSTLYYYRVKAINAFGSSQYSNIASTTTAVSPPNAGALPYTSGGLSVPQTPYLVQFFKADGTTNLALTGAWLGGPYVITSASGASTAGLSPGFYAKIGGVLYDGSDADQTLSINSVDSNPSYFAPGDGADMCIVTLSLGGYSFNINVSSIPYSADVSATPYSGEYFYPANATVGEQGWRHYVGGTYDSTNSSAQCQVYSVLSQSAATAIFGSIDAASIAISTTGDIYQNPGSPLICAGYTNNGYPDYFLVGPCSVVDENGLDAAKYTRCSHNTAWIQFFTGIDPIIYP